ncbi:MAG: CPBP family intramembrane metalloprotease [Fidelibacterota bacterium]|nr:MAG: CPBP family intramembrane metalloprotease [Candidatus Neomarinimicrobiota bacterium]
MGTKIRHMFINPEEHRLRAGWRLTVFLLAIPVVARIVSLGIKPLFTGTVEDEVMSWLSRGVVVVIAATLVVGISRRFLDKKTIISLGLRFDWLAVRDLGVGFVLSGLMVGVIVVALRAFGLLEIQGVGWEGSELTPWVGMFLWFLGIGAAVGWSEELGFRGYILQNLGEGIGLKWAVGVSCILYGIMHMMSPNASLLSGSLIAAIGFVRIFGWLRTGQLWLSMGMHAGWNFFQGPVFGFSVSGYSTMSLVRHSLSGPAWLTGGRFGPEAGIVVLPVVLLGVAVMFYYTGSRGNTPWGQLKKTDTLP